MVSAASTSRNAAPASFTVDSAVRIGTALNVIRPENNSKHLRRPMRSDSAPIAGCKHMKPSIAAQHHVAGELDIHARGVHQELLHVRGERVQTQAAARRERHDDEQRLGMPEQRDQAAGFGGLRGLVVGGLVQMIS